MAARKSTKVKTELAELEAKRLELEQAAKEAELEDKQKIESVKAAIDGIVEQNDVFCGVILSHDDLLSILKVALQTGEPIKIKYVIYHNE